jgi:hypothetical protein
LEQVATAGSFCRAFLMEMIKSPRHKIRSVATPSPGPPAQSGTGPPSPPRGTGVTNPKNSPLRPSVRGQNPQAVGLSSRPFRAPNLGWKCARHCHRDVCRAPPPEIFYPLPSADFLLPTADCFLRIAYLRKGLRRGGVRHFCLKHEGRGSVLPALRAFDLQPSTFDCSLSTSRRPCRRPEVQRDPSLLSPGTR